METRRAWNQTRSCQAKSLRVELVMSVENRHMWFTIRIVYVQFAVFLCGQDCGCVVCSVSMWCSIRIKDVQFVVFLFGKDCRCVVCSVSMWFTIRIVDVQFVLFLCGLPLGLMYSLQCFYVVLGFWMRSLQCFYVVYHLDCRCVVCSVSMGCTIWIVDVQFVVFLCVVRIVDGSLQCFHVVHRFD